MTRKWNACKKYECVVWEKGAVVGKIRLCPSSPSFLPLCHVWASSILRTQLSQNLEQANMTQEGVLLPQLTMYFIQIPTSLQNYSSTFSGCNMVPEISRTHFMKEVGLWMGIQWGESPHLYRTVDSGAIYMYKYQGPGAQYYFLSLKELCHEIQPI